MYWATIENDTVSFMCHVFYVQLSLYISLVSLTKKKIGWLPTPHSLSDGCRRPTVSISDPIQLDPDIAKSPHHHHATMLSHHHHAYPISSPSATTSSFFSDQLTHNHHHASFTRISTTVPHLFSRIPRQPPCLLLLRRYWTVREIRGNTQERERERRRRTVRERRWTVSEGREEATNTRERDDFTKLSLHFKGNYKMYHWYLFCVKKYVFIYHLREKNYT